MHKSGLIANFSYDLKMSWKKLSSQKVHFSRTRIMGQYQNRYMIQLFLLDKFYFKFLKQSMGEPEAFRTFSYVPSQR